LLVCLGLLSGAEVSLQSRDTMYLQLSDSLYAMVRSDCHPELLIVTFYKVGSNLHVADPKGVYLEGPFGQRGKPYLGTFGIGLGGTYKLGWEGGRSYTLGSVLKVTAVS
jgi:hypothetical protein